MWNCWITAAGVTWPWLSWVLVCSCKSNAEPAFQTSESRGVGVKVKGRHLHKTVCSRAQKAFINMTLIWTVTSPKAAGFTNISLTSLWCHQVLSVAYAEHLLENQQAEQAGLLLWRCGEMPRALEAFIDCTSWRHALAVATHIPVSPTQLMQLARDLAGSACVRVWSVICLTSYNPC